MVSNSSYNIARGQQHFQNICLACLTLVTIVTREKVSFEKVAVLLLRGIPDLSSMETDQIGCKIIKHCVTISFQQLRVTRGQTVTFYSQK